MTAVIWTLMQIAVGGALGAMGRHLTGLAANRLLGDGFPHGTIAVNVFGCLAMGVAFVVLSESGQGPSRSAPLIMTGFLGGYTTFSAYSLDFWQLMAGGRAGAALLYAAIGLAASIAALVVGIILAREALG